MARVKSPLRVTRSECRPRCRFAREVCACAHRTIELEFRLWLPGLPKDETNWCDGRQVPRCRVDSTPVRHRAARAQKQACEALRPPARLRRNPSGECVTERWDTCPPRAMADGAGHPPWFYSMHGESARSRDPLLRADTWRVR